MMLWPPHYRDISMFAANLAMGVETGLPMPKALAMALPFLRRGSVPSVLHDAVRVVSQGGTLTEALSSAKDRWPAFVPATISAGEETGRLDEALRFLERHCETLAGPANTLRNLWLFPLCILLAGDVAGFAMSVVLGGIGPAVSFVWESLQGWATLAVLVGVFFLPPVRPLVDQLRFQLPWWGEMERHIAHHRFFRILELMYGVSHRSVEHMIDVSVGTISNQVIQDEMEKVVHVVAERRTMAESFSAAGKVLSRAQLAMIENGETSGTLDSTFDQLASDAADALEVKAKLVHYICVRIMMAVVVMSLMGVAMRLISVA